MNFKIGLLAAVVALAAPVASYASTIKGDVQIDGGLTVGGNTSLTNGDTTTGVIDFNTSLVTTVFDATGDLAAGICTQQDAPGCTPDQVTLGGGNAPVPGEVNFASLPQNFWEVAGFFFNITGISSVAVASDAFAVTGSGVLSGNGFDETQGVFSISSDSTDSSTRIAFSSTTTAVPVPAAGLLLVGGLGGLAMMRRRQKKVA